jgi:hypothetical protein
VYTATIVECALQLEKLVAVVLVIYGYVFGLTADIEQTLLGQLKLPTLTPHYDFKGKLMFHYRWQISRVDGFQEHPQLKLENVIAEVYWELEVRDSTDMSVHYIRAMTKVPDPTPNDFTDYLELDHTDVLSMVWDVEGGREKLEQQAKQELNDLRTPTTNKINTLPPHWLASCCPDGKNTDLAGVVSSSSE